MTSVQFQPTANAAFRFPATLDGNAYSVIVTWNLYRNGYYVNVIDQSNVRVFSMPLIGSPDNSDISLTAGYFTTSLVFRQSSQVFEISA